jgi:alanine dehydrogenase
VDSIEQAKLEAGDLIIPTSWDNVVELKDIKPHFVPDQITIFKSLGIGVEDVAAAAYVYERALATLERFADRNRAKR